MKTLCALFFLSVGVAVMAYEEPHYEVVKRYSEFELRQYDAYLVAETEVSGDFGEVGNRAFRVLADFIGGKNRKKEEISMTAPVEQRPANGSSEQIAMTSPVTQARKPGAGEQGSYVFSFVMPKKYTLATLPEPLDSRIRVREVPGRLIAARTYSGTWSEKAYQENELALFQAMQEATLQPVGHPVFARYNSPFALWFLRRNEVLVEVKPQS
jgi:hypothetical protein